jgi:hypothetical protein
VRLGQSRGRVTSTVTKFASQGRPLGGEQCAAHGPHEAGGHEYRCFLVPAESRNQVHVGAADPIDLAGVTASQRAGVTTATRVSSMTRRPPVCLPSGRLSIPVLVPLSVWTDYVVVPTFKQGGIKTLSLLIGIWELRSFVLGQGQDSGVRR